MSRLSFSASRLHDIPTVPGNTFVVAVDYGFRCNFNEFFQIHVANGAILNVVDMVLDILFQLCSTIQAALMFRPCSFEKSGGSTVFRQPCGKFRKMLAQSGGDPLGHYDEADFEKHE